jgi:hypothetical protein
MYLNTSLSIDYINLFWVTPKFPLELAYIFSINLSSKVTLGS